MIKETNVAGIFYAADPDALAAEIDSYIEAARDVNVPGNIIGIVAPHAGYMYSGPVAGYAYHAVAGSRFSTVVVMAPSHFHPLKGISIYQGEAFDTPLGRVTVDRESAVQLLRLPFAQDNPAVFEQEHALEVHLPFLYRIQPGVKVVPVICGQMDRAQMRECARALLAMSRDNPDMLVVASTDLSHYHSYDEAVAIDGRTVATVGAGDIDQLWQYLTAEQCEACGYVPLTVFMDYVQLRGGRIKVLDYRNSGDTAGGKDRVVGYMAAAGYVAAQQQAADSGQSRGKEDTGLTLQQKKTLLDIARKTLQGYLTTGEKPLFEISDPALKQIQGAFVTLHKHGQLRGCIGNYGHEPLHETIVNMAVAAATEDPRFSPMSVEELVQIDIEISVLSPLRKVSSADEVVFGTHGVVVRKGYRQGVFLPQVAEQMRDKDEFLSYLCAHKAGLPADAWKEPGTEILVFTADVFSEQDIND